MLSRSKVVRWFAHSSGAVHRGRMLRFLWSWLWIGILAGCTDTCGGQNSCDLLLWQLCDSDGFNQVRDGWTRWMGWTLNWGTLMTMISDHSKWWLHGTIQTLNAKPLMWNSVRKYMDCPFGGYFSLFTDHQSWMNTIQPRRQRKWFNRRRPECRHFYSIYDASSKGAVQQWD